MWDMFSSSIRMFLKGKLFRDNKLVLRQWAIGFVVAIILVIVLGKMGVPVWLAAIIGGFAAGALQPYLFKDLKYN